MLRVSLRINKLCLIFGGVTHRWGAPPFPVQVKDSLQLNKIVDNCKHLCYYVVTDVNTMQECDQYE